MRTSCNAHDECDAAVQLRHVPAGTLHLTLAAGDRSPYDHDLTAMNAE